MVERWFVSHILMKKEKYGERDNVLLGAVKPAVEELEKQKLIETLHFLFEPNFEILFRVRLIRDASMKSVRSIVEQKLKPIKNLCIKFVPDEGYRGEGDAKAKWSFGTEGWALTQKFLEYGSRITLLMTEVKMGRKPLTAGRMDSQFNVGKLVHCFLNQDAKDTVDEAHFHIDAYFSNMLKAFGYHRVLERLENLEKQISQGKTKK